MRRNGSNLISQTSVLEGPLTTFHSALLVLVSAGSWVWGKKKKTLSASSLPVLLLKIAASTITVGEAPAALFKPTPALWQGRALSSSVAPATLPPCSPHQPSVFWLVLLFYFLICCCWRGSISILTFAFYLVCFLWHIFFFSFMSQLILALFWFVWSRLARAFKYLNCTAAVC